MSLYQFLLQRAALIFLTSAALSVNFGKSNCKCLASDALTFHPINKVTIVTSESTGKVENRIVSLLAERMKEVADNEIKISILNELTGVFADELAIVIGRYDNHLLLKRIMAKNRIDAPTEKDPGPEGFVLKSIEQPEGGLLIAAAVDTRGMLYAAGEILRQTAASGKGITFSNEINIRTAPAFEVRGLGVAQGHTMRTLTDARAWTEKEWQRVVLDYALAGANTFSIGHKFHFIKSYGLKTLTSLSPNVGSGPPKWQAKEAIGRKGYLCLSIPEARAAILKRNEERWKNSLPFDYVRMFSGDGGGCECEKCAPYGKTYIEMAEELAKIIHKYHPDIKIFATNQKLDNAGDRAIFEYLREKPREWLTALCYGPGSNAMGWQPGRRQDHRTDLYRYPAFGEYDRYLREILHQLPPQQSIIFYTGLTHWVYSEYGLVNYIPVPDRNHETPPHWSKDIYSKRPDPALAMVYNRRTFHARPRHYHHAFQETMRYGIGDSTYSEGYHDHLNQWMWQRLLWAPHTSVEEVVDEYARTWFGKDAAPLMAKAIFQLEENLSAPLAENEGIDKFCQLVEKAGQAMPEKLMAKNPLWRQYMQKAILDKYCQLRLRRQLAIEKTSMSRLSSALEKDGLDAALQWCSEKLTQDIESLEMKKLKAEADRLGRESDRIFGVRSEGLFNLKQDFIGLGWLENQIEKARNAKNGKEKREITHQIVFYDSVDKGEFYDDAGNPNNSPHLVYGWPCYGDGYVSNTNRPSQRTGAFTTDERKGVTFEYKDIDTSAKYRVRLTLVRPLYAPRFAVFQTQKTQSIYADGLCLAKDLELPPAKSEFFEFDIPQELTRDGSLTIWFEKSKDIEEKTETELTVWRNTGGWGTLVSEIWLLKR